MQQSKNLAITFLLGAVIVGGALGFTADRVMLRDRMDHRESQRDRLAAQLQLDSTQRTRLDSILDERNRHLQLAAAPVKPTLDSIKERAREEIRAMLTATQRTEFEKVLAAANAPNKNHDDDN